MPKTSDEPLAKIQLRLYSSDLTALRAIFSRTIGVNDAIRTIIRTYLRQVEAKAAITIDNQERNITVQETLETQQNLDDLLGDAQ